VGYIMGIFWSRPEYIPGPCRDPASVLVNDRARLLLLFN